MLQDSVRHIYLNRTLIINDEYIKKYVNKDSDTQSQYWHIDYIVNESLIKNLKKSLHYILKYTGTEIFNMKYNIVSW